MGKYKAAPTTFSTKLTPHNWEIKKTLRKFCLGAWIDKRLKLYISRNAPSSIKASLRIFKRRLEAVPDNGSHDVGIGWLLSINNSVYVSRVGLSEERAPCAGDGDTTVSRTGLFWKRNLDRLVK
jgi:hypothetical protein